MSTGGGAGPLVPTFHGFVHNSMDGLVLFEACLSGKLHHVPRRPHDRERSSLIKSGSIFIYEENASGIKRWTDGVAWSPSRILGNFLIYRELEKPFPPGEKKRAMKQLNTPLTPPTPNVDGEVKPEIPSSDQDKELERSLIGSLVDSYGFRPDGLVKKTMSISVNGISHHMVSYYKVDDVKNNLLPRPLSDPRLQNISVRPELYLKQNFRAPVEETEHYAIDGHMNAHPQMIYSPMVQPYGMAPSQYMGARQYPGMYGSTTGSSMYGAMTAASWPTQQATAGAMGYGSHQSYGSQPYPSYYKPTDQGNGSGVKTESQHSTSQAMPYGSQYAPSYPNMQRSNSVSAPSMMQSSYQTPVQPHSSTFGTMGPGSGRPSYSGQSMNSPSANGQSQGPYGSASTAPYAVRSPTQSYSMQSAPQSAVSHSPHPSMKSPQSAHPGTSSDPNGQLHSGGMPYRSGSYAVPSAPQTGHSDMNGLGISSTSSYPPPSQNGSGYSYGSTGHAQTSGPYPA